jgi:hypothetical protein
LKDTILAPPTIPDHLKKSIEKEQKERKAKGLKDEDEDEEGEIQTVDMEVEDENAYPNTDSQFEETQPVIKPPTKSILEKLPKLEGTLSF